MKKIILCVLLLSGCTSVTYNIENIKPNEYGFDKKLADKVYVIACNGNDYVSSQEVDRKCKEYMSEFAYKQGYGYFSVLDQAGNTDTTVGAYTTSMPVNTTGYNYYGPNNLIGPSTIFWPQTNYYSVTTHSKDYLFILVRADDLKDWKNYYRVSDYYTPKSSK